MKKGFDLVVPFIHEIMGSHILHAMLKGKPITHLSILAN